MPNHWYLGQWATLIEDYISYNKPNSQWGPRDSHCCVTCFWFPVLWEIEKFNVRFPGPEMVPMHPGFFRIALISRTLFLCAHKPPKHQYFSNRTTSLRSPPPEYTHMQTLSDCGSWFGVWKVYRWGIVRLFHPGFLLHTSNLPQTVLLQGNKKSFWN